ncbi:phosphotransferase [Streptomyces sp. ALB3]|uniref:phosphotransferase n=1 Tax=Streptomyces sp. ALB3 TaxID=3374278 RepID=UPI0037B45E17
MTTDRGIDLTSGSTAAQPSTKASQGASGHSGGAAQEEFQYRDESRLQAGAQMTTTTMARRLPVLVRRSAASTLPLGKLERHLRDARPHLAAGGEEFIRTTVEKAAGLPALEAVPIHGDFHARNLRWDEAADVLYVIDFERSEEGPVIRDFVRLSDAWHGRPDLLAAVTDGYGRPFTPHEKAHLTVLSVLDAVSGISYGAAHDDPELGERARRTLARLRAAQRP